MIKTFNIDVILEALLKILALVTVKEFNSKKFMIREYFSLLGGDFKHH